VGYGDLTPLTTPAKTFNIFLAIAGLGFFSSFTDIMGGWRERVAGEKASIRGCVLLLAVTMGAGTAAFAIAEHLAWYDSLYLAAMTGRSPCLRMRIHNLINDPIFLLKKGAMRVQRFVSRWCAQHRLFGNRAILRTLSTSMARLPRRVLGLPGSMFRVLGLLGNRAMLRTESTTVARPLDERRCARPSPQNTRDQISNPINHIL
jgi:hypothetical protein